MLQLSFSPTTPMSSHIRVLTLLIAMLLSCCGLAVVCGIIGYTHGMHTLAFMAAEVRLPSYVSWFLLCFSPLAWGYLGMRWVFFSFPTRKKLQRCKQTLPWFRSARSACFLSFEFKPAKHLCLKNRMRG